MNSDDSFEPLSAHAAGVLLRIALGAMASEKDCRPARARGSAERQAACGAEDETRAQRNGDVTGCVSGRDGTGSPCLEGAAGRSCAGE
jgi:hypothetical protein